MGACGVMRGGVRGSIAGASIEAGGVLPSVASTGSGSALLVVSMSVGAITALVGPTSPAGHHGASGAQKRTSHARAFADMPKKRWLGPRSYPRATPRKVLFANTLWAMAYGPHGVVGAGAGSSNV